jgi:hypothetical protein
LIYSISLKISLLGNLILIYDRILEISSVENERCLECIQGITLIIVLSDKNDFPLLQLEILYVYLATSGS